MHPNQQSSPNLLTPAHKTRGIVAKNRVRIQFDGSKFVLTHELRSVVIGPPRQNPENFERQSVLKLTLRIVLTIRRRRGPIP
jgi:hypothetical protein